MVLERQQEAVNKLVEFISKAGPEHVEKMHLINQPVRPMLAYEDEASEWFVAMDPYNGRFFIDEELMFAYPYDFHSDRNLHLKVDDWGKVLIDKARREAVNKWLGYSF